VSGVDEALSGRVMPCVMVTQEISRVRRSCCQRRSSNAGVQLP
jgi:hypothetical protein